MHSSYWWLFTVSHMGEDHSDSKSSNPRPTLHGLLVLISSKGSFISSILQIHFTNPFYNSILQLHFTNPFYKSILQIHFTTPFYKSILQIHFTNPFYKSILQIHITNRMQCTRLLLHPLWILSSALQPNTGQFYTDHLSSEWSANGL